MTSPNKKKLLKNLRLERGVFREIIKQLNDNMTCSNAEGSERYAGVCKLLLIATRHPINPDIVEAALQLYRYSDVVARVLLEHIADHDYKALIKQAKRGGR